MKKWVRVAPVAFVCRLCDFQLYRSLKLIFSSISQIFISSYHDSSIATFGQLQVEGWHFWRRGCFCSFCSLNYPASHLISLIAKSATEYLHCPPTPNFMHQSAGMGIKYFHGRIGSGSPRCVFIDIRYYRGFARYLPSSPRSRSLRWVVQTACGQRVGSWLLDCAVVVRGIKSAAIPTGARSTCRKQKTPRDEPHFPDNSSLLLNRRDWSHCSVD